MMEEARTARAAADIGRFARANIRTYAMVVGLIVLIIGFGAATGGTFFRIANISNLVRQMAVVGILGTGMAIVLISGNGNIDLSVGSALGLIGGLGAYLIVALRWSTVPTIIILLVLGLFIGFLQGTVIARLGMPAFIVTLGGMLVCRGALHGITKGKSIAPFSMAYQYIGQGYLNKTAGVVLAAVAVASLAAFHIQRRRSRRRHNLPVESLQAVIARIAIYLILIGGLTILLTSYRGVHIPVLVMVAIMLGVTVVASQTKMGRRIYAFGGNSEAARFAGIDTKHLTVFVFALNGFLVAIAGIVYSARINAGIPIAGQGMELDAIAAAVIGGASMSGGIGLVPGALLGALIMATIDNGMSMLNAAVFWQLIVKGAVVIVAVWFDVYTKSKTDRGF